MTRTDEMTAGSIHVEDSVTLPGFLQLRSDASLHGWSVVDNMRAALDEEVRKAGMIFLFIAGKIEATAFGFNREKTLRLAVARLVSKIKGQNCNSFQVMQVTRKLFMGFSRVSISAHARHLQQGPAILGS